jgi:hypothetical protein
MADGLTDAAKAEIAAAIRIVREDRIDKLLRDRLKSPAPDPLFNPNDPPKDPPKDPDPKDPPKDPITPPPAKDPTIDPPIDEPKGKRSAYWGEILD